MMIVDINYKEAEKLLKGRVDRRLKYGKSKDLKPDEFTGAIVFQVYNYRSDCSGCTEYGDYGSLLTGYFCEKRQMTVGIGCFECGYTGIRRHSQWIPANTLEEKRELLNDR